MSSTESVKTWWQSLSAQQRKTVMGVGSLGLLLLILYAFMNAGPKQNVSKAPEARADTNLLTGSDARTLGMEAVGAELRQAQVETEKLKGKVQALEKEIASKKEIESLNAQIEALKASVDEVKEAGDKRLAVFRQDIERSRESDDAKSSTAAGTVDPEDAARRGLFDNPEFAPASTGANRGARGAAEMEPIRVQILGAAEKPADSGIDSSADVYIPAGSMISGVLLTGVDAPTGLESKRDPIPALMRIKHDAILPNRFKSDVRECFVILGATGDLSTERALMRAETLSCIRRDGGVIEVELDAYAMGDDGKAGIRGRLVTRNGSLVAKAAFASFAEALSQIFRPVAITGLNTSATGRTQFQAPDAAEALEASGYAGFGGAMRRLSEYFVDLADEIVPFVEVDAARQVEAVLLKGVTLRIRES